MQREEQSSRAAQKQARARRNEFRSAIPKPVKIEEENLKMKDYAGQVKKELAYKNPDVLEKRVPLYRRQTASSLQKIQSIKHRSQSAAPERVRRPSMSPSVHSQDGKKTKHKKIGTTIGTKKATGETGGVSSRIFSNQSNFDPMDIDGDHSPTASRKFSMHNTERITRAQSHEPHHVRRGSLPILESISIERTDSSTLKLFDSVDGGEALNEGDKNVLHVSMTLKVPDASSELEDTIVVEGAVPIEQVAGVFKLNSSIDEKLSTSVLGKATESIKSDIYPRQESPPVRQMAAAKGTSVSVVQNAPPSARTSPEATLKWVQPDSTAQQSTMRKKKKVPRENSDGEVYSPRVDTAADEVATSLDSMAI